MIETLLKLLAILSELLEIKLRNIKTRYKNNKSKIIYHGLSSFYLCICCLLWPTIAAGSAATSYITGSKSLSANDSGIVEDSVEAVPENSASKFLKEKCKWMIYLFLPSR